MGDITSDLIDNITSIIVIPLFLYTLYFVVFQGITMHTTTLLLGIAVVVLLISAILDNIIIVRKYGGYRNYVKIYGNPTFKRVFGYD